MDDYQKIESVAQNYDGIFTLPLDTAATGEILKKIMKKTKVGFMCSVPLGLDWNDPNFAGISDADAYQAGVNSAKAAVKILNGKEGGIHTCLKRY